MFVRIQFWIGKKACVQILHRSSWKCWVLFGRFWSAGSDGGVTYNFRKRNDSDMQNIAVKHMIIVLRKKKETLFSVHNIYFDVIKAWDKEVGTGSSIRRARFKRSEKSFQKKWALLDENFQTFLHSALHILFSVAHCASSIATQKISIFLLSEWYILSSWITCLCACLVRLKEPLELVETTSSSGSV